MTRCGYLGIIEDNKGGFLHLFHHSQGKARIPFLLLVWVFLLSVSPALARDISIQIPQEVLARMIHDTLPLHLPIKKRGLSGDIWIQSMENLVLGKNEVSFRADIRGKDIRYLRKIRNRPLDLRFGNIKMLLECRGTLRYDPGEQTLYITPYVREEIDKSRSGRAAMGVASLIGLFSGIEYPLGIQGLKPLNTCLGKSVLKIRFRISDIRTRDNMLFIDVKPSVEARRTDAVGSSK